MQSGSYQDAIDGYIYYFRKSIERRIPHDTNLVLPLTGGRDSRHILFELMDHDVRPSTCVTLRYRPPATNEDEKIARLICNKLNLKHETMSEPKRWFQALLDDIYLTNFCGGGHSWILPLMEYYEKHNVTCSFDGLAGDVISAGHKWNEEYNQQLKEGEVRAFALQFLNEANFEAFNKNALRPVFYKEVPLERAIARVTKELEKHLNSPNPLLSFTFWNRTRRAIGSIPTAILAENREIYCPYLDRDFFNFCTSLESSISMRSSFHDHVIQQAYPSLSDIPYENGVFGNIGPHNIGDYYIKAVSDFLKYFGTRLFKRSEFIKISYLQSRVIKDRFIYAWSQPWYLRRALYILELEEIANGK